MSVRVRSAPMMGWTPGSWLGRPSRYGELDRPLAGGRGRGSAGESHATRSAGSPRYLVPEEDALTGVAAIPMPFPHWVRAVIHWLYGRGCTTPNAPVKSLPVDSPAGDDVQVHFVFDRRRAGAPGVTK